MSEAANRPDTSKSNSGAATTNSIEERRAQVASLLQRASTAGTGDPGVIAEVARHLPEILDMAKSGHLDAKQLAQLRPMVQFIAQQTQQGSS